MKNIKFSIIVPIYNAESYIEKCIDSVLTQTFKNYELILVNDGSEDNSLEIVKKYSNLENVLVISKKNTGVSDTRNIGLKSATGDWITFLDSDDWLDNNALEIINEIIEKNEVDIIQSNLYINNKNQQNILNEKLKDIIIEDKKNIIDTIISVKYGEMKYHNIYGNCRCAGGKFYKHDLIKKNKIEFIKNLAAFEDGIFNLHAYYNANKIYIMKNAIYHYRYNNNSQTHNYISNENQQNKNELIIKGIKDFFKKYNIGYNESFNYCLFDLTLVAINNSVGFNKSINATMKEIKNIIKNNNISQIIKKINISYLKGKDKIFYYLMKFKLYVIMYIMYKIKIFIRSI